jgi:predicted phosphodiesterase
LRALIVSDLHSNSEALRVVLNHVRRKRYDHVICLGDFVGYGAQPNQVLDVMRRIPAKRLYIRGNHDRVAAGLDDGNDFNFAARSAALWTKEHLSRPNRAFLQRLPLGPVQFGDLMLCHGSPYDEDEYVFSAHHAAMVFKTAAAPIILYGHTHLPVIFSVDEEGRINGESIESSGTFRLDPSRRYLVNPGSVGQPRDHNPAASFAMYDSDRRIVQFFRVEYDLEKTRSAIIRAGLPPILADRLTYGT